MVILHIQKIIFVAVLKPVLSWRMDQSHINQNFELNKSKQKFHHNLKEHHNIHKISNIPKFRCEML